ncbi:tetratricopeptide repeat protein [candidate division KSB1 bacterium]|nr:tetratricopeptide repeat protein [candidate division KSB1 bacterium]
MKLCSAKISPWIILTALLAGIASTPKVCAQESKLVTAILMEAGNDLEKLSKLIEEHEKLLKKYPHSDFAATVMFQLAELYEQKSNLAFQHEMAQYELNLAKFDSGMIATEPIMPRMSLEPTINYCLRILRDFPSIHYQDKVLYKLAMAYLQEGNLAKAKSFFEQIIEEHPNSNIVLESHFRIGEYYFDKREFSNAIKHYKELLGKWDNPYFNLSLYKLGWSYYNINDYSNSISTFIYLIEDISHIEKLDSKIMGRSMTDLRQEAIHYISSCFAEYGGPAAAYDFLESRKEENYALQILNKLAGVYERRNYYSEAIETYEIILTLYPFHPKAPEIYQKIVLAYESDDRMNKANETRQKAIEQFSPNGFWVQHFPLQKEQQQAIQLAKAYLLYLGKYHQAEAQTSQRMRDYAIAIDKYKQFLETWPRSEQAAEISYYLAECYYEKGDYNAAADAYNQVVIKYDSSGYQEDAAYNRILCYYQLLSSDPEIDSTAVFVEDFLGSGDLLTLRLTHQSEINLIKSCNDYVRFFPNSRYTDEVLMKFAETLHELKLYFPAVRTYKKVVELGPERPYYLAAAMNAGQSLYDGGYFDQAELWLGAVIKRFPDSTAYVDKAQKLIASSQFKLADELSQIGSHDRAAQVFETIADNSNDAQFKERALFSAAAQYEKNNNYTQASLALEKLAQNFPNSPLVDEALYKAGEFRELKSRWTLACTNYTKLIDNYPMSKYLGKAIRNAALCYENLEDWYAAQKMYQQYARMFPDQNEERMECLFKSGLMYYKTNRYNLAMQEFRKTINYYNSISRNGAFIDNYFVAQSQFMIGEIHYNEYKNIEVKPPLNLSLKDKTGKLNIVLNSYKETLKYQIADWSTAASCRIGMAYEELVRAFIDSPLPPGLDPQEAKQYAGELEKSVKPYKKRALETYRKTVEQAELNQIENTWIAQSRERMTILLNELDSATEMTNSGTGS